MSLKHAILILLEQEPGTGYDIFKRFKNSLGYFWNAKHQQVYLELKKLYDAGWLDVEALPQDDKPDKKIYRVTQEGRNELKRWLEAPAKPNKINDALLVKLFGGHFTTPENLISEMARHRNTHENTLRQLKAIEMHYLNLPATQQAVYRLPYLTLRRGILGEEAWLAWADEVDKALGGPG